MTISYRRGTRAVNDGSGTSISAGYSSNDTGDLLWFGVGWLDAAGTVDVTGVSDTAGNPWTPTPIGKVRNAAEQYSLRMYYVATGAKASSSTNTVSVTLSGSATYRALYVMEYRSSIGPWTFDMLEASAGGTGSGTSLATSNMTPSQANDLVAGMGGNDGGTFGAASPYILRLPTSPTGGTGATDRILSGGAGTGVAARATASSSGQWSIIGALFKDVATVVESTTAEPLAVSVTSSNGRARALMVGGTT